MAQTHNNGGGKRGGGVKTRGGASWRKRKAQVSMA
jgi:hypothetical protein